MPAVAKYKDCENAISDIPDFAATCAQYLDPFFCDTPLNTLYAQLCEPDEPGSNKPTASPTQTKALVAQFEEELSGGVDGFLKITPKALAIDLDFSGVDWEPFGGDACYKGGMSYHIHDFWGVMDTSAKLDMCGSTQTGGHYDPTYACGPASGNSACKSADCPLDGIPPYQCSPDAWGTNPLACEAGDLSGKHGKIEISFANKKFTSIVADEWLTPTTFTNEEPKSIVIHCNGGKRAFCAKLDFVGDVITPSPVPTLSPSKEKEGPSLVVYAGIAIGAVMVIGAATLVLRTRRASNSAFQRSATHKDGFFSASTKEDALAVSAGGSYIYNPAPRQKPKPMAHAPHEQL